MRISALFALLNLIILIVLSSLPLTSVRAMSPSGLDPKQVKLIGSMIASAVFGLFSMAIILFKKDESDKKWAYGMLGTIVGFWLPSVTP